MNEATKENIICIIPGDGVCPRTGYLVAKYFPNWTVLSVDPIMDLNKVNNYSKLNNLICIRDYIENVDLDKYKNKKFALLHVHSHANFETSWKNIKNVYKIGLTIPCCEMYCHIIPNKKPHLVVDDNELLSVTPKNKIIIYL